MNIALYEEDYLKGEIEHSDIVTHGIHGVMEDSSNNIDNYLEEANMDGDHSLGVITKSYIEEETLFK